MLFKKTKIYTGDDGVQKTYENFYVQCGDGFIPIQVKYFGKASDESGNPVIDYNYKSRKAVLSSHAVELPEKSSVR